MSRFTLDYLSENTRVGYTEKRGNAWHWRKGDTNHFTGAVPFEVVKTLINFPIVTAPVMAAVPSDLDSMDAINGEGMPIRYITDQTRKVVIREDTGKVMGVHGEGYNADGYGRWLLTETQNILATSLTVGSCGLLDDGAKAWVQIEEPDTLDTPEGVSYRPHLLAVSSLDGSMPNSYRRAVTVVVCDNTLSAALGEAQTAYRVRRTRHASVNLDNARKALNIVHETADDFARQVRDLCRVTVTDRMWSLFLDQMIEVPSAGRGRTMATNKRDELTAMYRKDPRCAPWKGTGFGVIQTWNTYETHARTVRGTSRVERNMERNMRGEWDTIDNDAMIGLSKVMVAVR